MRCYWRTLHCAAERRAASDATPPLIVSRADGGVTADRQSGARAQRRGQSHGQVAVSQCRTDHSMRHCWLLLLLHWVAGEVGQDIEPGRAATPATPGPVPAARHRKRERVRLGSLYDSQKRRFRPQLPAAAPNPAPTTAATPAPTPSSPTSTPQPGGNGTAVNLQNVELETATQTEPKSRPITDIETSNMEKNRQFILQQNHNEEQSKGSIQNDFGTQPNITEPNPLQILPIKSITRNFPRIVRCMSIIFFSICLVHIKKVLKSSHCLKVSIILPPASY